MLGQQVGLEPADEHGVGLEESPPGRQLRVGESPQTSHEQIVR
jgi:hypothetical protein